MVHFLQIASLQKMSTDEVNGSGAVEGGIPVDDLNESNEGLLDSDQEEVKGQEKEEEFRYPDEGELDYDELMENEVHLVECTRGHVIM